MAKLTAAQVREKHARNLKNATSDIQNGINAVTVAPGELAAKKEQKMKQNLIAAIDSGKWKRGVSGVTLEEWKRKTLEKGISRIGPGVDAAAQKIEKFYGEFLPFLDNVAAEVNKLPDLTLSDNIQRMVKQVELTAKFRRS